MDRFPDRRPFSVTLYRFLLRVYTPRFREAFGPEMLVVFQEQMQYATTQGRLAALITLLYEFLGLFFGGLRQRLYARQSRAALAGGGAALLDGDGFPWRAVWQQLVKLIPFLVIFLLFRACLAVHYVTLDDSLDVRRVTLGDVDGDGRTDAFLSLGSVGDGYWRSDRLLLNQGEGLFVDSGQDFGEWRSFSAAIGDVTGDGLADVVSGDYAGLRLFRNQGAGPFATTDYFPSTMGTLRSSDLSVAMADLDGDGWQDVFVAACCGSTGYNPPPVMSPYSEVWLNDGEGRLASNGQQIGRSGANAVALGDLDGDGDLDAVLAHGKTIASNPGPDGSILRAMASSLGLVLGSDGAYDYKMPNSVWFNDGQGAFVASDQQLGRAESLDIALGDLNGDGFLDLVVGNNGPDELWLNDGQGHFNPGRQRLERARTWSVDLADFDGDGNLDLLAGGETTARVWLNDGNGLFRAGQVVRYGRYESVAAADLDGDGIVDLIAAGPQTYRIWHGLGDGRFNAGKTIAFR